jgi:hypothetical protein
MKNKQSVMTAAVLANGAELAARVIEKINTDAISKTLQGTELSRQTTYNTANVIFQQEVTARLGG